MALGQDDTPAQISAGGVALPVILPGMPGGEIFAKMNMRCQRAADRAIGEQLPGFAQRGMKAVLEPDQYLSAAAFQGSFEFVHAVEAV